MAKIELKILIGLHRKVVDLDRQTGVIAGEYGLTFSQFMVLEALYSKGEMTVGQVRDQILSSVGTISLVVNNLVKQGYVQRLDDPKDRRVCILRLTDAGKRLISQVVPRNEQMIEDYMQGLNQAEKADLLRLLKKFGGK